MCVLPDSELTELGPRLIDPFDPEFVQPASIDLRLHHEFIVFDAHNGLFIDLADVDDRSSRKVVVSGVDGFVLHPNEFVLGATYERVDIPDNLVARIEGKSSIGRLGILVHVTAGFVDPGFEGRLTLEIANLRKIPIILRPGLPFCQLSLTHTTKPVDHPYSGRYKGDDSVAGSRYDAKLKGSIT